MSYRILIQRVLWSLYFFSILIGVGVITIGLIMYPSVVMKGTALLIFGILVHSIWRRNILTQNEFYTTLKDLRFEQIKNKLWKFDKGYAQIYYSSPYDGYSVTNMTKAMLLDQISSPFSLIVDLRKDEKNIRIKPVGREEDKSLDKGFFKILKKAAESISYLDVIVALDKNCCVA